MYRKRRQKRVIIFSLLLLLTMMSIGYAAFQTKVKVKGTTRITSVWDVRITNVTSGTATGSATNAITPTWTGLTANMEANLYQEGDAMEYDVTITNSGTIDAVLSDVIGTPSNSNAVIITFSGYAKGEVLHKSGVQGNTKTIHVKIEYNPEYTGGETSGEANVEFTYEQGEGGTVEPIPTPDPRYLLTYDCTTNGGAQVPEANQYYDSGTTVTLNKTCTKDGWTFVGWNTSQSATSGQSSITMNSNKTVYAIYRKEAITLTANFNANNATLSSTASQTCTIAAVYNNNIQATSCEVTAPTITGPSATPTVVGFNLAPDSNSNRNNHNNSTHKLTLTSELDNKTWYAQTMKDPVDRTITFYRNNNTNFIYNGTTYTDTSKTFTVCTIPAAYNGATQETSCAAASVTMPTITAPSNTPNLVGWSAGATNRTATYTSGQTVTNLSMTANKSYYAQTASGAAIDRKITFYRNSNTSFTYDGTTYTDTSKTFTVCTIAKTYNGTAQGTSCTVSSITMPTITAPSATPTLIGWSAGATNRTATYTSGQTVTNLSMTANKSYYAQSTAPAVTLKARWDANGATLSSTTAQTCNISATYNGTTQGTTCEVTAPTITGPSNTPNVIGFNLNSTDTTNNSAHNNSTHKLTLNTTDDTGNGRLWYAITASGEVITLKASWNANNATLSSSTPQTCTIAVSYNGTAQGTTCEVTAPTITGPSNTPNVVGFNTSANSTTNNSSYNTSTGKLTLNTTNDTGNGRTWYAITASGAAVTLKANWNANNATLSSTTAKTCTLAKTYNGTAQATTCEVDAPTITAPANTPNVIGFNTSANSTTNNSSYNTSTGKLTLSNTSDTGNGRTWYAITESGAAINRTITFYRNSNTNFIYNGTTYTDTSKTFTVCTIPKTYNGTAQASSCTVDSITMPTITAPSNTPNLIGWSAGATNRTATYTSGQTVTNLSMTANKSYYAQTASGDAINRTITFYRNSNTNFIYSGTTYTDTSKTFTVCTIAKTYNGTAQGTSCTVDSITMPTITAPSNTPTLIGWSTGASTRTATYTSGQTVTSLSMTANKTYYAQSTAEAVTLKASWNANNATLSSTTAQTCTLAATYNGTAQNTTCTVDAPTITPPANTPNVVGFNTSANSTTNNSSYNTSTGKLTLNKTSDTGNGRTWYAITASGDAITLKASWNANNATLSNSSAKTCTIAKTYNGTAQASSCTVDAPTITGPANTPNVVGFNLNATDTTNNSAHNNSTHKLTLNTTDDTGNGRTWYAITASGDAITLKASWNANNATLSSSTPQTCTLAKTYNGTAQGTTCEVTAPTITAPANTPNVVGWNTSANSTTNNSAYNTTTGKLTLNTTNDTGNGRTWYAITASGAAINRTITFYKNNNTSFTYDGTTYTDTSKTFTVCTIPKTYNGTAQGTSCTVDSITMPTITAPSATPNLIGWSTGASTRTATYTSGQVVTNLSMTANKSYYAQTASGDAINRQITFYRNSNTSFTYNGTTYTDTSKTFTVCTIAKTYNGTAQATSCTVDSITMPTITAPSATPNVIGWSTGASTRTATYTSGQTVTSLSMTANKSYYAQSTAEAVTLKASWNANNATLSSTTAQTCTLAATYNGTAQNTTCTVDAPTITPPANTPNVVGFNLNSTDTSNNSAYNTSTGKLTLNKTSDTGNGRTWYAITASGDAITLKASWNANNATLSNSSAKTCTIAKTYNGAAQASSCTVDAPTITGPANTPNVVGFNLNATDTTNNSAHNNSTHKLTLNTTDDTGNGRTWYAITASGDAITLKASWNANNATLSSSTPQTCTIAKTYNGTAQGTTCEVTAPTITAPANTPNVVGWNTSANSTTNNSAYNTTTGKLTLNTTNDTGNGRTWYAITESGAAINRTITFYKNNNTSFTYDGTTYTDTSKTFTVCTIPKTYNGIAQATSCTVSSITMPTITAPSATPNIIGWSAGATNRTATYTSGQTVTNLSMTANMSLYAQSTAPAITLNANFNANGATLSSTESQSCDLAATFNGTAQATTCTVDAPTITRTNFTITGFNTTASATTNNSAYSSSTGKITLTSSLNNNTWYAITSYVVTINYAVGANTSAVGNTSKTCTIQNSATTCGIEMPTITPNSGYFAIGFNTGSGATKVGYKPGSTVSFSEAADGRTYYGNSAAKPSFTETLNGEVVITYPTGCGSTFTCTYKIGSGSNSTVSATTATAYVGTDATVTATAEVANTSYSGQSGTATHSSKRTKLYVSSSGNDSTGYGTLNKPYATIPKAYTSATSTSSASYIYAITNLTQSTALAANSSKTVTISSCTKSGSGASATCTYDNNKTVTKGSALNASRSITVTAGELSLYRITFDGNSIASTKGAVYVNNANAKFNVKGTAYISNFLSSGEVGAGVYLNRGTMTQTGGYIQNNSNSSSTRNGAGVYISANGTFNQSGGYIRNNTTAGHGGGVYSNGTMTMTGGTITNNTSTAKYGGGVYAGSGSTFTMSDSATISSNHATGNTSGEGGAYGGGINCAGTCNLNGGTISSNQANSGGGVDVDTNGVVTLAGATISSNTATYQSAGVHVSASTTFTFTSGSITGNTAVSGASFQYAGGIKCNGDCTMSGGSITDNNITGSSVSSSGGAIHIGVGGRFTLSGGTITGNRAHAYGDIYCSAQGTYDPKSNGTQTCGSNVPQTRSAKCL